MTRFRDWQFLSNEWATFLIWGFEFCNFFVPEDKGILQLLNLVFGEGEQVSQLPNLFIFLLHLFTTSDTF